MKTMKKLIIAFGIVLTLFVAALTVSAEQVYTREGNKIYFGSYPQSKVTDTALIATLNEKAGTLPTSSNSQAWTDYNYYSEGKIKSYMWYIDIEQGGEKYRGVYFTEYRPHHLPYNTDSYQDDNGYYTKVVYWFKYDPISWTVIDESGDTALLLCDLIIDAQEFDYKGSGNYSNNYAESTIRSWLNNNFYNVAFSNLQKEHILITNVDNSAKTTGYNPNSYACSNTNDKIFLLSYADMINSSYGFSNSDAASTTRIKYGTDYAHSQGFSRYWWLRSPSTSYNRAEMVYGDGRVHFINTYIYYTFCGVVPALRINTHIHSYEEDVVAPTCTEQGYTNHICSCGDTYKSDYVDETGHNFIDGRCFCGANEYSPMQIFTFKGYSIGPDGKSVCAGYEINYEKIEAYKAETNLTLEFGAVFTLFDALEGKAPLDSNTGDVVLLDSANVVKADISELEYLTYEFKIIDISDEFKDYALVIAGYVYNGERVIYCQDSGYSENVSSVSFNQMCQ